MNMVHSKLRWQKIGRYSKSRWSQWLYRFQQRKADEQLSRAEQEVRAVAGAGTGGALPGGARPGWSVPPFRASLVSWPGCRRCWDRTGWGGRARWQTWADDCNLSDVTKVKKEEVGVSFFEQAGGKSREEKDIGCPKIVNGLNTIVG